MHEIKRYRDIPQDVRILIDNYNCHTENLCILEKITFFPVYRVFGRNKSNNKIVGEKYFIDVVDANRYWSQLAGEKEYLF